MRFKKTILILFCSALIFSACKKDVGLKPKPTGIDNYACPFNCGDTALNYNPLPPEPVFGYMFAPSFGNKSVWRVIPDPTNPYIIYYLTSEQTGNSYHLWQYNIETGMRKWIDSGIMMFVDVNKKGWIVYDKMDWNVYKIKINGDSLTQLTFNGSSKYPTFSEDGNFIYYLNDIGANGYVKKVSLEGDSVAAYNILSWAYEKKNKLYFMDIINGVNCIIQKDLSTGADKIVLSGNSLNAGESINNWFPNSDGTVLYWWSHHGLSSTDLSTLKNYRVFTNPLSSRSHFINFRYSLTKRFFVVFNTYQVVNSYTLREEGEIFEFSEDGRCRRKINIPN